jgi:hypothetical protein
MQVPQDLVLELALVLVLVVQDLNRLESQVFLTVCLGSLLGFVQLLVALMLIVL